METKLSKVKYFKGNFMGENAYGKGVSYLVYAIFDTSTGIVRLLAEKKVIDEAKQKFNINIRDRVVVEYTIITVHDQDVVKYVYVFENMVKI